ncbi:TerD family protein [Bacillus altitudinis MN12]|uniref:TerD family protein n=2 Tax=Bacillus TaxID=1386 RepID=A0AAU7FK44_9BACI|nr:MULTISPECIES: TerD family protein [Bacillus]AMM87747.1 stress protein [Bacillus pumilus]KML03970.1 stress protein [Bacillus stratosphericus]MBY0187960.1 TerD family protein [Bacillus aerophilus]MDH8711774.1 stress response protein SCP2 [Micromonospora sp. 1209]CVN49325.1 stress response protein%2C TerZ-and CABP1 [Streptococcus pneumoniae]
MAITLEKGQRIDLTKGKAGLTNILVGLGWDPVSQGGGFLGKLFGGGGGADIDCDASVLMLKNDKFVENKDLIYFGNLKSKCGSVEHTGDNLTGEGDGDDEQVLVNLSKVPGNVNKLVFVVNIYDALRRNQHFGMIQNAYIRIVDRSNNQELVKYNLKDEYAGKTSLIVGELYRHENEWKFAAVGNGTNDAKLADITRNYI